ncbi:SpoIVB peptidase [Paenibacillus crassostreae]|uniref:SpoIVB peptidase n=1 Tax=Paenibacillus crassostreae TaxID=1763538 RepID=A0A167DHZ5_9BACL|nr:SpoIVB peptidase [Paenibacillus crassostreae]AOZ91446.1 SpoIVB peptidase [Paenibacillus crassostreae]OAB74395.1 SpoIVB peptidase [Paenibacillus crassostreae]
MSSNLRKKLFVLLSAGLLCFLGTSKPVQSFAAIPNDVRLFTGNSSMLQLAVPVNAQASVDRPDVLQMNGSSLPTLQVSPKQPLNLSSHRIGNARLTLKLFGTIPIKTVRIQVIPGLKVFPGGQTIGVKVKSAGILVVGHHLVTVSQDNRISPGENAGIQLGDLMTHMDGVPLTDISKVGTIVEEAGIGKRKLEISFKRGEKQLSTKLTPAYDEEDKAWRLGLYIRDSAAGVGTLTFYAPDQGVYGALGHVITDMNTQTPIEVGSGQIVESNVTSISKSQDGEPGEKRAHFLKETNILGNIISNTHFGIFGKMTKNPEHGLYKEPISIAFAEEVKEGPAEILTVVDGQQVEKFKVEIVHVARQDAPSTKGLVLKITDPKLINKTGGIVQGMSGSPIVQNGKLIGAVTHVFVNDPKSGYGCFIEWMLQDSGVIPKQSNQQINLKAS